MQEPTLPGTVVEEPEQVAVIGLGVVVVALDEPLPPTAAHAVWPVHVLDRMVPRERGTGLGLVRRA